MNQREAKGHAYLFASDMLREHVRGGIDFADDPQFGPEGEKINVALAEIIESLARRAVPTNQPTEKAMTTEQEALDQQPVKPTWQTDNGSVQLYCADCLDVLPTLAAGSVDAVVTDPPYGIDAGRMTMGRGSRNDTGKHCPLDWDNAAASTDDIMRLIDGRPAIVWGGNYFGLPPSSRWLVWDKCDPNSDFASAELAWTNLPGVVKTFTMSRKANSLLAGQHPTQKPVALMLWCLSFLPDAETILDPFMGSGTTIVACIRTGRRAIGIEREKKYFDIAVERCERELKRFPLFTEEKPLKQGVLLPDEFSSEQIA